MRNALRTLVLMALVGGVGYESGWITGLCVGLLWLSVLRLSEIAKRLIHHVKKLAAGLEAVTHDKSIDYETANERFREIVRRNGGQS